MVNGFLSSFSCTFISENKNFHFISTGLKQTGLIFGSFTTVLMSNLRAISVTALGDVRQKTFFCIENTPAPGSIFKIIL